MLQSAAISNKKITEKSVYDIASNTTPKVKIIAESADKRSLDRLYTLGLSEFEKAKGA